MVSLLNCNYNLVSPYRMLTTGSNDLLSHENGAFLEVAADCLLGQDHRLRHSDSLLHLDILGKDAQTLDS